MMKNRELARFARHKRIRKRIFGTVKRPRLSVHRSLKYMYVQIINDESAHTLLSLSTQDKDIKKTCVYGGNIKAARLLGECLARRAKEKGITKVVFDRGGYIYHGRVKAMSEEARKAGLEF